ncbi:MAG: PilN domain-containing protein [bacterium]
MKKHPVTIEIGANYLKTAILKDLNAQSPQIIYFQVKEIVSLSEAEVGEAIKAVFHRLKIKPHPLSVSIPRNLVTFRKELLPSKDSNEISKMLELKIGEYVPYARDEVSYGWIPIGQDENSFTKVMLAIIQRSRLRRTFNILEQAELLVEEVNLSSCNIWSWITLSLGNKLNPDELYLALDIDIDFADLMIFSSTHLLFSRSISIKANELEEKINCRRLVGEIRQSLIMFQNEEKGNRPVKIFLSGITKSTRVLADFLKEDMELSVTFIPSFGLAKDIKVDVTESFEQTSTTSLFPFIKGNLSSIISFTLPDLQLKRSLKKKIRELITLGSLVISLTVLIVGSFLGKIYTHQSYLSKVEEKYKLIEPEVNKLSFYSEQTVFLKKFIIDKGLVINLLKELYLITPENVFLANIELKDNKLILKGEALQLSDVSSLMGMLEKSSYFEKVENKYTQQKESKGQSLNSFEINIQLQGIK